ncbi:hypothetical protein [Chakrabartyella piscis]|uniref:hypothetical protein n=1 Tax=Chakrabartyella piscis TaxID=2918914 RepID=UPI002958AD09|nr:hypothetical protein [Chakrabartyella piscis]
MEKEKVTYFHSKKWGLSMNANRKRILISVSMALLVLSITFVMHLPSLPYLKKFGIDFSKGKIVSEVDTLGWMGDGYAFATMEFQENGALVTKMQKAKHWHTLPLSNNLQTFIYQPYDSTLPIPEITNGYYYFYDRHSESETVYDDKDLLNRHSFNFTLAIYDVDCNTLYTLEYNT